MHSSNDLNERKGKCQSCLIVGGCVRIH